MNRGPDLNVGELLASLRNRAGMTQEDLAVASGLSVRSISDIERSKVSRPRRRSLELLAEAFGMDAAQAKTLIARSRGVKEADRHGRAANLGRDRRVSAPRYHRRGH